MNATKPRMRDRVLELVKQGKTTAEISVLLGIAISTVRYHREPKRQYKDILKRPLNAPTETYTFNYEQFNAILKAKGLDDAKAAAALSWLPGHCVEIKVQTEPKSIPKISFVCLLTTEEADLLDIPYTDNDKVQLLTNY